MRLIQLIFEIYKKFVPIAPTELSQLHREAEGWETKAMYIPKEGEGDERTGIMKLYCKVHEGWFARMVIAGLYLPLVNYFLNMGRDEEED